MIKLNSLLLIIWAWCFLVWCFLVWCFFVCAVRSLVQQAKRSGKMPCNDEAKYPAANNLCMEFSCMVFFVSAVRSLVQQAKRFGKCLVVLIYPAANNNMCMVFSSATHISDNINADKICQKRANMFTNSSMCLAYITKCALYNLREPYLVIRLVTVFMLANESLQILDYKTGYRPACNN